MSGLNFGEGLLALVLLSGLLSKHETVAPPAWGRVTRGSLSMSCDYLPVVSTVTGIAKGIFWGGCLLVASTITLTGAVAIVPCLVTASIVGISGADLRNELFPYLLTIPFIISLAGLTFAATSLAYLTRAAVSTVPIFGNVTLLLWDDCMA